MAADASLMASSRAAADIWLFVQIVGIGLCMGVAYDGLRICRNTFTHKKCWVDREDLVFWICAGLLFFDWLVRHVRGELRLSEILAVSFGVGVYEYTISPFLVRIGTTILGLATKMIKKLFFPAFRCIKWLKKHFKRGKIKIYAHLDISRKRKKSRGERKTNGESRI